MFGIISSIQTSDLNLVHFSTQNPNTPITSLDQYIEDISPAFRHYLSIAVLGFIYGGDMESRCLVLDKYFKARTDESHALMSAICSERIE
jgi:hypothetical protein